jgi:hypothetical protein
MIYDISIITNCDKCKQKIDLEQCEGSIYCTGCDNELEMFDKDYVCAALDEVASLDYHWDKNNLSDITFADEPEKRELFFHGVKQGYLDALFWIADWFDVVKHHEEKILPIFRKKPDDRTTKS